MYCREQYILVVNVILKFTMSTKCQKNDNQCHTNDDRLCYDCFTMEHFRLRQRMTLTTKIYCSRLYVLFQLEFYDYCSKCVQLFKKCNNLGAVFG
jgi:hypothetical protein